MKHDVYVSSLVCAVKSPSQEMQRKHTVYLVDSGATHSCVKERALFSEYKPGKHVVRVADGKSIAAVGKGIVKLDTLTTDNKTLTITMNEVYHVPSFTNNIFSTARFTTGSGNGHTVLLGDKHNKFLVTPHGKVPLVDEHNLVWLLAARPGKQPTAPSPGSIPAAHDKPAQTMPRQLFHERLGHINFHDCARVAQQQNYKLTGRNGVMCDVCEQTKMAKQPITDLAQRADVRPGAIIHCDIKGPVDPSYHKRTYALVMVDEATRMVVVRDMVGKGNLVDALRGGFAAFAAAKIVIGEGSMLHSDSESVFQAKGVSALLASKHVVGRASPPYTHERNGIAERKIRTLFDTTRALLRGADMSKRFWTIALQHAAFLLNHAPTTALGGRSPVAALAGSGVQVRLPQLYKFGSLVAVKIDDARRTALDDKSRVGIYVGHNTLSNSHRVLLLNKNRWDVVDTIHCRINENVKGISALRDACARDDGDHLSAPVLGAPTAAVPAAAPVPIPAPAPAPAPAPPPAPTPASFPTGTRLDESHDPLLDDFDDVRAYVSAVAADGGLPRTYAEAMKGERAGKWSVAIQTELTSLIDNKTFETVPATSVPHGAKVLDSRWVLTEKTDDSGAKREKARLVVRGDRQRAGLDYEPAELYAPVIGGTAVRAMLAVAAANDYELDKMDAVTAFLNAPLQERLYMRVPAGFDAPPGSVLRLNKSLYGLKQAPRYWNRTLHDWLIKRGLQQSAVDQCLYFQPGKLWVLFWVDDFLVMSPSKADKDQFKAEISQRFKMRDLGPVQSFLNMQVTRDRSARTLHLRQDNHIRDVLERFGQADAKPAPTPLPPHCVMRKAANDSELLPPRFPYRALVGSLLYIAMWTRPDIAYAVSQVARFQQAPTQQHWEFAKHIVRYLKGTQHLGLTYSAADANGAVQHSPVLRGYADASWAEDPDERLSHSAHLFTLANAAISWRSARQRLVTLSSTEAEYVALSDASREALFLRNLLVDFIPSTRKQPVTICEDNQSTIMQASNLASSDKSKHVAVHYHFVKQHVALGDIALQHIPTAEQPADALTKSLDRNKVSQFRQSLLGKHTARV